MTTLTEIADLEVIPSGHALGAEIRGVDLSAELAPRAVEAIEAAWAEHLVLVFRGQRLSDPDLLRFSSRMGELDPPGPNPYGGPFLPEHPELNVISNIVEAGRPIGNLGAGEAVWHADMTYVDRPPKGAVLHALEVPPEGGDTHFANMYAAYANLPDDLRVRVEGRRAVHDASRNSAGMLRKGYAEVTDVRETVGARHPLVRTDPATGRRALFLGRRPNAWVVGLEVADSDALLDALWAHATDERFTFTHRWQVGDVLMWSNLAVLHRRDPFDPDARRLMHRTQLQGTEAIA